MMKKKALLFSGGIGDYLHYIVRVDDFMARTSLQPRAFTIIVESTNAARVKSLFANCLPEFDVFFMPDAIHWTKTNPLLDVNNEYDRRNRPAFIHAALYGYDIMEDWFLPFLCMQYAECTDRLQLFRAQPVQQGTVCISARNKGCAWWPSAQAIDTLAALLKDRDFYFTGTADEHAGISAHFVSFPSVFDALVHIARAGLFIGTDTGFATLRELLGLQNIYCIDEYWYRELMVKYLYWTDAMARKSISSFAFSLPELQSRLADALRVLDGVAVLADNDAREHKMVQPGL